MSSTARDMDDALLDKVTGGFTATDDLWKVREACAANAAKDIVLKGKKILQN